MFYLTPEKKRKLTTPSDHDWPTHYQRAMEKSRSPTLREYYAQGICKPETPINQVPLVAVDFETTGLNPEAHGIVSIAAIPMTTERIFFSQSRSWVVKPREALTDESVVIHGITHSDIEQAPDLTTILDDLLTVVAGKVWVVHYRGVERPFLQNALKTRLGESIQFPVIDTMEIEALFHRKPLSLWQKLTGHTPASIRLDDSRRRYHLPFYPPHNAMTDALACAELLQAQLLHHFSPDTPVNRLWLP